jgi:hypothetical protein
MNTVTIWEYSSSTQDWTVEYAPGQEVETEMTIDQIKEQYPESKNGKYLIECSENSYTTDSDPVGLLG